MPLTQVSPGLLDSNAQYYGFKNRIINGAMVIDQRNNGNPVTPTAGGLYPVDRFIVRQNTDGTAIIKPIFNGWLKATYRNLLTKENPNDSRY